MPLCIGAYSTIYIRKCIAHCGKKKIILKNATVIEQLAKVDTIVFDKTGTITTQKKSAITQQGNFSTDEIVVLKNALRGSNHPLSRRLYDYLPTVEKAVVEQFDEITGKGIQATINGKNIKIGSAQFVGFKDENQLKQTNVHISIDDNYLGKFTFDNQYRDGLQQLFSKLSKKYNLKVLSGDNEGEKEALQNLLPPNVELIFNQKPNQKLDFIENLQLQGKNVLMIGDGLNDAGALAQSNVGISISENVNVFSPACDGILDASQFEKIAYFLQYSKNAMKTIYMSFGISLLYNVVGLSFAISGNLLPIVAAIIMPLSTITIVSFVTVMSNIFSREK
jgi:Cu+-exporting ATPase